MPIQVDHERQRDHVTSLAARVIAQEGVAALTFRRVADAAGSSTAIVSTYFTDKRDLLLSTFRAAASRTTVRFEAAINAGGSLQDCLEAWLPLDEDRLTQQILALTLGIALQAVFEPAASASLPQRALLTDGLARLTQR